MQTLRAISVALLLCSARLLRGQEPADPPGIELPMLGNPSRETVVFFTVTDDKDKVVANLQPQDFVFTDQGKRPERLIRFTRHTNFPLYLGLVVEASSLSPQARGVEEKAAAAFFGDTLKRLDGAFVAGLNLPLSEDDGFTRNMDSLLNHIHNIPTGNSGLFDVLYENCRERMLNRPRLYRHAIVLVSDGNDHGSKNPMSDAIQMCQRAETTVYSIRARVDASGEAGDEVLRTISTETGGRPFFPTRPREIAHAFTEIKEELESQYSLEYVPANLEGDGRFRTIHLEAINHRYHVRTRKGYFSQVFQRDQPYVIR
ncbi:VWA domain-containing protein [Terriglobus albidus]|uniref:VWA domain-containing protein n=1 Tax=Terriglobus albidus TaxID=1592106 RepID=A0A5B9E8U5_9BACT|nr:VWA domain-containing protein [Terriglobus albidus]QEE26901.1 VWA domain-containing protein [Terriglobus albidus]